jgi:nucleotide-binding universal stress UspA family protein
MYKHVLAASDFSDLGDRALARAIEVAIEFHAKLTLVHVIPSPDTPNPMYAHYEVRAHVEKLEESRARAREALSERAARVVENGMTTCAPRIVTILHPSPASPLANRGFERLASQTLVDEGVWD